MRGNLIEAERQLFWSRESYQQLMSNDQDQMDESESCNVLVAESSYQPIHPASEQFRKI